MASFTALKTAIQNAIKQNGNEEITGDVLQQILLSIVNTMGDGAINTIEQNLSSETLARQGADNTLQSNINAEALARGNADTQLQNAINAIKANIDNGYVYAGIATPKATPVSGKVFYIATAAGTYTNFGGQVLTQGINILRYNGSEWSNQQLIGIDDVPTAGSNNLLKSGGVQNELALGAVYDVSAKNPTGGPNNDGKWESLSALLSDANLNTLIPTAYRKGGMSIKFVHTSDNKYAQYMYKVTDATTTATFTNVANWEKINLEKELNQLESEVDDINEYLDGEQVFVDAVVGSGGVITFNPITLVDDGDALEFCTLRESTSDVNVGYAFAMNENNIGVSVGDGVIGVRNSIGNWVNGYTAGNGHCPVDLTYTGVRSFKLVIENGNLSLYQTFNGDTVLKESQPKDGIIQIDNICGSYNGTEWVGTLKKFIYTHNGISKDVTKLAGFATSGNVTVNYESIEGAKDKIEKIDDLERDVSSLEFSMTAIEGRVGTLENEVDDIKEDIYGKNTFANAVIGTTGAIKFNTISLAQDGDSIEFKTLRDESTTMGIAFLTLDDKQTVIVQDGVISILLDNNNWQTNFNMSNGTAPVGLTNTGVRTFKLAVENGNINLYQDGVLKASGTLEDTISFNTLCYRAVDRWDASKFYYWEGTLLNFKYTHAGVTYEPQELPGFTTSGDITITYSHAGGMVGDISDLNERVGNLEEAQTESEYTVAEEKIIPYTDNSGYVSSDTGEIVIVSNGHTAIIDVSSGDITYIRTYQTEFWSNYGYGFVLSDNSWVGVHTTQNKEVVIPVPENAVTFKMAWNTNAISAVQEYFYLGKKVKIEDEFKKKKTTFQFLPDFDLSRVPNVSFIQQTNDINDIYGRYDALISEYPSYVTKVDCSDADSVLGITRPSYLNNIPIYMYCFKPTPNNAVSDTNYIKRPSVLILTGTHAGEKLGIYTTYSLMKMVCENWKNDINAEVLRTMADIYVIPLVNPWGFINCVNPPVDNPYAGRTNGNGVNLNRNFPTLDWHSTHTIASGDYEGSSAGSEYETKIVCYYASQIEPDVFFDWHTGNMNAAGNMGVIESIKNKAADSVCLAVSKSMSSRLIKDNGYDGNIGDFPNNPDTILISYDTFNTPPITGSTYIWGFENVSKLSILTEQCPETKWKDGVLTDTVQSQNTDVIYRENLQFSYNILLRALYAASQLI